MAALARLPTRVRRRLPWLALSVGLLALVTGLTLTQLFPRLDRMLQDNATAQMSQPATDEIVIVAMDEKSMDAIGRWPWRRWWQAPLHRALQSHDDRSRHGVARAFAHA